jgi:hypothetical protein
VNSRFAYRFSWMTCKGQNEICWKGAIDRPIYPTGLRNSGPYLTRNRFPEPVQAGSLEPVV